MAAAGALAAGAPKLGAGALAAADAAALEGPKENTPKPPPVEAGGAVVGAGAGEAAGAGVDPNDKPPSAGWEAAPQDQTCDFRALWLWWQHIESTGRAKSVLACRGRSYNTDESQ